MALGNNTGFGNSGSLLFLSPRSKDKDKKDVPPHFVVGRSVDGKIVDDADTVTQVSGDLFRIEFKEREFNGETFEEPVLYLRGKSAADETVNESYRLPIRFGIPGRGLFNRMASLTDGGDFTNLQVDYYRNKNGYETFGLKQNKEPVKWKFENKDLPVPLEIKHPTTGKVLQRDYTELNALFRAELQKIADKVNKAKPAGNSAKNEATTPVAAPKAATASKAATEKHDDTVPF
jgi:hypothetical protein